MLNGIKTETTESIILSHMRLSWTDFLDSANCLNMTMMVEECLDLWPEFDEDRAFEIAFEIHESLLSDGTINQ